MSPPYLPYNVSVTEKEANLWTKLMKQAVNLKIKLARRSLNNTFTSKAKKQEHGNKRS